MGVFEHFPYVNYHELNLSWILRKLKELEDVIGSQIVDIVARAGVAENAQAIADLTETVETVETTATSAGSAASAAQTTADSAASAASAAQTTATEALNKVNAVPTFGYVTYDIPNDTTAHVFDLPAGFNHGILVAARLLSKYGSWVDYSYGTESYFGDLMLQGDDLPVGKFRYAAHVAGNAHKIQFLFAKID